MLDNSIEASKVTTHDQQETLNVRASATIDPTF